MLIGIDASKASLVKKTGIDNTAYQIILALSKIDHKNKYLLYTNSPLDQSLVKEENFQEKLIPFPKFWNKFRLPLALLKDKPQQFLELTSSIPPLAPKKSIVLVHDLAFKLFPEAYSPYELMLQESAIKIAINRAKKIIFTSEANKDDFFHYYKADKRKAVVIPLAYDKDHFKEKINSNDILGLNSPYFLYVGRLERRKNVTRIIESFEIFKNKTHSQHKLVLVGKNGYGSDEVEQKISESPYKSDIIRPGYISEQDLPSLYGQATLLLYPSLYEGFGLPMLEAMACAIPVITSNVPTLKEIGDNAACYVNPLDPADIATGIEKILTDQQFKNDLVKKGLNRVKQYSWQNTAEKILELINKI